MASEQDLGFRTRSPFISRHLGAASARVLQLELVYINAGQQIRAVWCSARHSKWQPEANPTQQRRFHNA